MGHRIELDEIENALNKLHMLYQILLVMEKK